MVQSDNTIRPQTKNLQKKENEKKNTLEKKPQSQFHQNIKKWLNFKSLKNEPHINVILNMQMSRGSKFVSLHYVSQSYSRAIKRTLRVVNGWPLIEFNCPNGGYSPTASQLRLSMVTISDVNSCRTIQSIVDDPR